MWSNTLRCRGVLARANVGTGGDKGLNKNFVSVIENRSNLLMKELRSG